MSRARPDSRPRHRSGCSGIHVRKEGDRFLAIPGTLDRLASKLDHLAQLGRSLGYLDLEVADIRDLLGHAHEKGGRQRCAAHRGILDHDRDVDRVRYTPEKVADRAVSKLASEASPSLTASPR